MEFQYFFFHFRIMSFDQSSSGIITQYKLTGALPISRTDKKYHAQFSMFRKLQFKYYTAVCPKNMYAYL